MIELRIAEVSHGDGTRYVLSGRTPLELGGQGANEMDVIRVVCPAAWDGMTVTAHFIPRVATDTAKPVAVVLDASGEIVVTNDITAASAGEIGFCVTDGVKTAYSTGLEYRTYRHPAPDGVGQAPTQSVWEQFVECVQGYANTAAQAAGTASAGALTAAQAANAASLSASGAEKAAVTAEESVRAAQQAAAQSGYVYFAVDPGTGHLMETKTGNVQKDITFVLNENGRLEAIYE